jgi:hypothetical protein
LPLRTRLPVRHPKCKKATGPVTCTQKIPHQCYRYALPCWDTSQFSSLQPHSPNNSHIVRLSARIRGHISFVRNVESPESRLVCCWPAYRLLRIASCSPPLAPLRHSELHLCFRPFMTCSFHDRKLLLIRLFVRRVLRPAASRSSGPLLHPCFSSPFVWNLHLAYFLSFSTSSGILPVFKEGDLTKLFAVLDQVKGAS